LPDQVFHRPCVFDWPVGIDTVLVWSALNVTSHSAQGLTAERVLIQADTSVHPDLLDSRFAYVSISRACHQTCFQDRVCVGCVSLFASQGGASMARKVGKYRSRARRWLIQFYLGLDHETGNATTTANNPPSRAEGASIRDEEVDANATRAVIWKNQRSHSMSILTDGSKRQ